MTQFNYMELITLAFLTIVIISLAWETKRV